MLDRPTVDELRAQQQQQHHLQEHLQRPLLRSYGTTDSLTPSVPTSNLHADRGDNAISSAQADQSSKGEMTATIADIHQRDQQKSNHQQHDEHSNDRSTSSDRRSSATPEKPLAMHSFGQHSSMSTSRPPASSFSSHRPVQAGVQQAEAIAKTWDGPSLALAYLGIGLMTWATSLEGLTTTNLTVFATSAFNSHSLVSTVLVVQGVVLSVAKPPMSKFADVFGRFEAFCLAVLLCVLGYLQQALATQVGIYAAAQLFYAAGSTGLQILVQIFIADTSDLLNRALFVTLPDLPFMVNVWLGPPLAELLMRNVGWRWGYGIWAVILPICFIPLAVSLAVSKRKAARRGLLPLSIFKDDTAWGFWKHLWFELDLFGLFLICASFSLILIPMTLASRVGWYDRSISTMLIVGILCLIAFPLWERNQRLAPHAFVPPRLLSNRTVLAGFGVAFFYFMAFYMSVYPYFQSYLLVVMNQPLSLAGRIVQTFTFASTVTSLVLSFLIKRTKRYKRFMTIGTFVYFSGLVLMFVYRQEGSSTFTLVLCQTLVGIGGSLIHLPAQIGVQAAVSHQQVAAATALFLTILEIGGAVGSAISGAIWTNRIPARLEAYLPPETQDMAVAIYGNITLASTGWPVGSPTREAINRAYQETMTEILKVAVCVAIPCLFLSILMCDFELDKVEQHITSGPVLGAHVSEEVLDFDNDDDDDDDDHNDGNDRTGFAAGPSSLRLQDSVSSLRHESNTVIPDDEDARDVADEEQPLFGERPGIPRGASLFRKFRRHT